MRRSNWLVREMPQSGGAGGSMKGNGEKKHPQWETLKDFEKDGLVVRVQKSGWRYSLLIGVHHRTDENRIVPFLPVRVSGTRSLTDKMRLERNWAVDMNVLVEEALGYIIECEEYHRARNIDHMVERDEKYAERGKKKTRRTGKTERTRQKRKERMSQ